MCHNKHPVQPKRKEKEYLSSEGRVQLLSLGSLYLLLQADFWVAGGDLFANRNGGYKNVFI